MTEMPQGLIQAFAQDMDAMRRFAQLSGAQRAAIVNRARNVTSREEMEEIVKGI